MGFPLTWTQGVLCSTVLFYHKNILYFTLKEFLRFSLVLEKFKHWPRLAFFLANSVPQYSGIFAHKFHPLTRSLPFSVYYYRKGGSGWGSQKEWGICKGQAWPQSRQSAKRFSSRWNWDSPTPLAAGECAPPPFGPGGRAHSLAAKGVGKSQFQRGDIHCGALYI